MKRFIALHHRLESDFWSIIAFSDDKILLEDIIRNERHFGSDRHEFLIYDNVHFDPFLKFKKDICLINICKNVAEFLAVGEYTMLKKSYFNSSSWFEKAKNLACSGSYILNNY